MSYQPSRYSSSSQSSYSPNSSEFEFEEKEFISCSDCSSSQSSISDHSQDSNNIPIQFPTASNAAKLKEDKKFISDSINNLMKEQNENSKQEQKGENKKLPAATDGNSRNKVIIGFYYFLFMFQ